MPHTDDNHQKKYYLDLTDSRIIRYDISIDELDYLYTVGIDYGYTALEIMHDEILSLKRTQYLLNNNLSYYGPAILFHTLHHAKGKTARFINNIDVPHVIRLVEGFRRLPAFA